MSLFSAVLPLVNPELGWIWGECSWQSSGWVPQKAPWPIASYRGEKPLFGGQGRLSALHLPSS